MWTEQIIQYLQCVDGWDILERVSIQAKKNIKTHVAENKKDKEEYNQLIIQFHQIKHSKKKRKAVSTKSAC